MHRPRLTDTDDLEVTFQEKVQEREHKLRNEVRFNDFSQIMTYSVDASRS